LVRQSASYVETSVRFALRHLKEKHPETLKDRDVVKLNMSKIMEKFFK
jgi:hypothetical protein